MSEAKSKPPDFKQGMTLTASMLQQLSDWCWQNRTIFGSSFTTNRTVAGQVVEVAGSIGSGSSSSSLHAFGTVASTVSAASSKPAPDTYGTGTVTMDVDGGSGYTAGDAVTVKNRWPMGFDVGDLLLIESDDGGTTWMVVNRFCPTA